MPFTQAGPQQNRRQQLLQSAGVTPRSSGPVKQRPGAMKPGGMKPGGMPPIPGKPKPPGGGKSPIMKSAFGVEHVEVSKRKRDTKAGAKRGAKIGAGVGAVPGALYGAGAGAIGASVAATTPRAAPLGIAFGAPIGAAAGAAGGAGLGAGAGAAIGRKKKKPVAKAFSPKSLLANSGQRMRSTASAKMNEMNQLNPGAKPKGFLKAKKQYNRGTARQKRFGS